MSDNPTLVHHRQTSAKAAIVLVHGFGGNSLATWGNFPALLQAEPSLQTRAELDDRGLVGLALALDSVGRRTDAIKLRPRRKRRAPTRLGCWPGV